MIVGGGGRAQFAFELLLLGRLVVVGQVFEWRSRVDILGLPGAWQFGGVCPCILLYAHEGLILRSLTVLHNYK